MDSPTRIPPGNRPAARIRNFPTTSEEKVMQINVKGHQVDVTPALHDYVTSKFERVTRHYDHLHELNVVLGVEKLLHKAEATIQCSGKKTAKKIHADATAADMYAAIDALVDKIDKQVRKHKEKLTDHHPEVVRATRYT